MIRNHLRNNFSRKYTLEWRSVAEDFLYTHTKFKKKIVGRADCRPLLPVLEISYSFLNVI